MKTVLVTGGAGFIGSNFLNLMVPFETGILFVNFDKLTYAGNPMNLQNIENAENYAFERADICDQGAVNRIFEKYRPDCIIHFAAESHVDRSICGPRDFLETNVLGTLNLLEACRATWKSFDGKLFHHVSTDEVYGSLDSEGSFKETTAYNPSSPYSASKAGADHLVRSYYRTYGLPVKVSNCSNNYGPYQFPEKLIPLMIINAVEGRPLPVYGAGDNVRDWLYVTDHCEAIWTIVKKGRTGETYNIGGGSERRNLDVVNLICDHVADLTGRTRDAVKSLISFVSDRPGHDFRYAIDFTKIKNEIGWKPKESFDTGIKKTVSWYLDNSRWLGNVRSGEYRKWMKKQYDIGEDDD